MNHNNEHPDGCCAHCEAMKAALVERETCTCDWWGWRGEQCPHCEASSEGEGK